MKTLIPDFPVTQSRALFIRIFAIGAKFSRRLLNSTRFLMGIASRLPQKTPTGKYGLMATLIMLLSAPLAHADDLRAKQVLNKTYQQECASCHIAFPTSLLHRNDWNLVMQHLDQHYGTDASLDADSLKIISDYLQSSGADQRKYSSNVSGKALPRLTQTAWFIREHREVSSAQWQNPQVKTAANCTACHTQAQNGSYREREIRLP